MNKCLYISDKPIDVYEVKLKINSIWNNILGI